MLADLGNVQDTLFIAARAALWDLRIPRTREIEFAMREGEVPQGESEGFGRLIGSKRAVDYELPDSIDEGAPFEGRESLPVCIGLNLVSIYLSPTSCPTPFHIAVAGTASAFS